MKVKKIVEQMKDGNIVVAARNKWNEEIMVFGYKINGQYRYQFPFVSNRGGSKEMIADITETGRRAYDKAIELGIFSGAQSFERMIGLK